MQPFEVHTLSDFDSHFPATSATWGGNTKAVGSKLAMMPFLSSMQSKPALWMYKEKHTEL